MQEQDFAEELDLRGSEPAYRLRGEVEGRPLIFELGMGRHALGSARDNDLRLVGPGVSRRHALLRVEPEGLVVEDLGSKNGIFLDGRRIVRAAVVPDSRLAIGPIELVVERMVEGAELAIRFETAGKTKTPFSETADADTLDAVPDAADARERFLPELRFPADYVVGRSRPMLGLYRRMAILCRARRPILLHGETGVGKELLARTLHDSSADSKAPYVMVNCAAIPESLLEAEMFGIVRGAASGIEPRPGYFALAEGGTLFLDEIGELAPPLQAKLLRVLQEGEIQPVGGKPRRVDVWVVAATHVDLQGERLRSDLYYRLAGGLLEVPPLRKARADIPILVRHLLGRSSAAAGVEIRGMTTRAVERLRRYPWPGNIRQLAQLLDRLVAARPLGGILDEDAIDDLLSETRPESDEPIADLTRAESLELRPRIEAVEKALILEAKRRSGGRKIHAARLLGISRSGLDKMLRRLGLVASWTRGQPASTADDRPGGEEGEG